MKYLMIGGVIFLITTALAQAQFNTRDYPSNATRPTSGASLFMNAIAGAVANFFNPQPIVHPARPTNAPTTPAYMNMIQSQWMPATTAQTTGAQPCMPSGSGPTTGGNTGGAVCAYPDSCNAYGQRPGGSRFNDSTCKEETKAMLDSGECDNRV